MNFFKYLGVTEDEFIENYLQTGLVSESLHKQFPLNIFTYSRKCVSSNAWDGVTSKCRGIIINRGTDEIVARPFEKFHNWGSTLAAPTSQLEISKPVVMEKVDGFMCTLYTWEGVGYIASKGSFTSIQAKWATVQYRKQEWLWPDGYTPVFEGLCSDLRIVVDYGDRTGLVLLALINTETGEELQPDIVAQWARLNGIESAKQFDMSLLDALEGTLRKSENACGEEGYVLTWYQENAPPFRLKVKFTEYLRLHRMVSGVSPKRIWEVLSTPEFRAELDEYILDSTPWFSRFVKQWVDALNQEFVRLKTGAEEAYARVKETVRIKVGQTPYANMGEERRAWAAEFMRDENKEFTAILFSMLDNKNTNQVIWKRVKEKTTNGHPLVSTNF
jgi:RNA ligase